MRGSSDAQAAGGAGTDRPTAGGVDANTSKEHLFGLTRELVRGVRRASDAATRRAREDG